MATNFSSCKGSYVPNQFPSNVMFGMNGFHVSASGAIQGHHGPFVIFLSVPVFHPTHTHTHTHTHPPPPPPPLPKVRQQSDAVFHGIYLALKNLEPNSRYQLNAIQAF